MLEKEACCKVDDRLHSREEPIKMTSFGFTSAHAPLLTTLHSKLVEYEDAVNHAYTVREKYGLGAGFNLDAPTGEMEQRMKRTSHAFEAVLQHVDAVDLHVHRDYVLMHRDVCAAPNALFKAPLTPEEEEEERANAIHTRSPILQNASSLELTYRPVPSCELMVQSPILAHSRELRELAAGLE